LHLRFADRQSVTRNIDAFSTAMHVLRMIRSVFSPFEIIITFAVSALLVSSYIVFCIVYSVPPAASLEDHLCALPLGWTIVRHGSGNASAAYYLTPHNETLPIGSAFSPSDCFAPHCITPSCAAEVSSPPLPPCPTHPSSSRRRRRAPTLRATALSPPLNYPDKTLLLPPSICTWPLRCRSCTLGAAPIHHWHQPPLASHIQTQAIAAHVAFACFSHILTRLALHRPLRFQVSLR
jgi:hypothetical protein